MCHVLNASRSGYYEWRKKQSEEPTQAQKNRDKVKQVIKQLFHENYGIYGAPRIHKELLATGYTIALRTVGLYMKQLGLRATPKQPFTVTTDSNHPYPVYPDLLKQDFEADKPNKKWVSDITYIWTSKGWVYLAVVIDLYARKVVGWQVADHLKTELALDALKMAIRIRRPKPGWIHHSDRGSQYAAHDYRKCLKDNKGKGSMSRKGNPYDNACVESFFASLKKEYIYRHTFQSIEEVIQGVQWYISFFYNDRRRHSKLDYISPNQYEIEHSRRP